jgi:L-lactate dehydrogenase complex protein LldG
MADARSNILARLRQQAPADTSPGPDRGTERHDWPLEERIQRFTDRMTAVRAEVHRVTDSNWVERLLELAIEKGLVNLLYAPDTEPGRRLASAINGNPLELLPYVEDIEGWKDRLFNEVDGAVTGCLGAIAETGSLILWPDKHEPRLMSLVPPVHFALLDAERIFSTFAEAVNAQNWPAGMPTNALLVSGPSKSADIEQTLAYGVHGPKELVVLLVG